MKEIMGEEKIIKFYKTLSNEELDNLLASYLSSINNIIRIKQERRDAEKA